MAPLVGPVGVGALVDAIMFGCLIVQSCVYYKNTRGDSWFLKLLVLFILFLLLSHLGCMTAWLWASTEGKAGSASLPDYAPILFGISSVCGAVVSFLQRCFFSHRILKVSKNHFLAFLFFVFCVFSFTAASGAATVFFTNGTAGLMSQLGNNWIFPVVTISGLACDLAINIVTGCYVISEASTAMADSLESVSRILLFVAETGAVTSLFDAAVVIVYWLTKANFAWVGLIVCMPGVFANALLVALNARGKLCPEIEHQQVFKIGERLIDDRAKRPPILIAISKKVDRESENSPV